jgi:ribonuclease BN (tRNA processing enzyme)
MTDREQPADKLFRHLHESSDAELLRILTEADNRDELLQQGLPVTASAVPRHPLEITFLGSLGCRLGMLAGGAGGFVVRIHGVTLLVDPGPGALYRLALLQKRGVVTFADLDAILCTHLHPDHMSDLLPCIEGMLATRIGRPRVVVGNETVIDRFRALSPYHFRHVETRSLAPLSRRTNVHSHTVALGDIAIRATPTKHTEEAGRQHTGIGFLINAGSDSLWYSGDTSVFPGLLDELARHDDLGTVAIANADASDIAKRPGKAEKCHLLTRDIPVVCMTLKPLAFVIQHYDEAYSDLLYRTAQAIYAQRCVDRVRLDTRVLFAGDGLRLGFKGGELVAADACLAAADGVRAAAYAKWRSDSRRRRIS